MSTPVWMTGFEYGVATLTTNGGGLVDIITGSELSVQNSVKRSGGYALRVNPAAATSTYMRKTVPTAGVLVGRFYIRFDKWPSSDDRIFWLYIDGVDDPAIDIETEANGHRLQAYFFSVTPQHTAALTLNTWYRVDFKIDLSANPRTFDMQLDGTPITQVTKAVTTDTFSNIRFGAYSQSQDIYFDDMLFSETGGDYPIGDGKIVGISPGSDGTHSNAGDVMQDNDGNHIGDVTAYDHVNSVPMSATTYIKQTGTGTDKYAEVNFADLSDAGTVHGAIALLAYRAGGTAADEGGCIIIDEDATATTVWGSPATRADYSESSLFYKNAVLPAPSGGWDQTAVNALKARMGYSNDVADVPYWVDLMVEVDYVVSGGSSTPLSVAGSLASSGTVVKSSGKPLAGAVASAGALVKSTAKALAGGMNSAGTLIKSTGKTITGSMASAGVLVVIKAIIRTWTGAVASAGTLVKSTRKTLAGGMASSGVFARALTLGRTFTGAIASAGTIVKSTAKTMTGAVASSGTLGAIKAAIRTFTGGMASSGTLIKSVGKGWAAGMDSSGGVIKQITKGLAGAVGLAGALNAVKVVAGGLIYALDHRVLAPFRDKRIYVEFRDKRIVISFRDKRVQGD